MKRILCFSLLLLSQCLSLVAAEVMCPDTVVLGQSFWYEVRSVSRKGQGVKSVSFQGFHLQACEYPRFTEESDSVVLYGVTARYQLVSTSMGRFRLPDVVFVEDGRDIVVPGKTVWIAPEKEYASVFRQAYALLLEQGMEADSLHLVHERLGQSIHLFNGYGQDCFVALADDRFSAALAGNLLLAWSTESTLTRSKDSRDTGVDWIFGNYQQQLQQLATGKSRLFQPSAQEAAPLLGDIRWGQDKPYNNMCTQNGSTFSLAGCGAIAIDQVLMFYRYPPKVERKVARYKGTELQAYDLDGLHFDWQALRPSYDPAESDPALLRPLGELVAATGLMLNAKFGTERTSTNTQIYRTALVNNLGYSASAHFVEHAQTLRRMEMVCSELQEHRPVIASGGDHAFVIDGYSHGYFHFNMGWNGAKNGYYRALLSSEGELAFKVMVVGIQPRNKQTKARTVTVEVPGTLREILTEQEVLTLDRLDVSGQLNGLDVRLLRRMAGAVEDDTLYTEMPGRLTVLDLSRAHFVEDKENCFLRYPATGYRVKMGKTLYDFSHMTHSQWEAFLRAGLDVNDTYFLSEEDGSYWINCHTVPGWVSQRMWRGCENLQYVSMPEETEAMGDAAFSRCTLLREFRVPARCTKLGRDQFTYCKSLEQVTVVPFEGITPQTTSSWFEGANPLYQLKMGQDVSN